ncbi:nuclear transport factor 2 family protein [Euzebya sp.]|uniref:nuclear transport factor 2 family protein n=1 Tax=Euzebya sp. TaxID=1971409 RepID=UPI0035118CF7
MGAPAATDSATEPVVRRFMQCRRRGPLDPSEITQLLTEDAEYVEIIDGKALSVTGAVHIAEVFRRLWGGIAPGATMQVIRHAVVDEGTAVGHWVRSSGGVEVHGRDTLTLTGGRISRITVEEFAGARIPDLTAVRA